jgi:Mg/Co/Ni transporter MgtE
MGYAHSLAARTLSAGVAESYMRQLGCMALYVVDDDRKPLGLITHRDLMSAEQRFNPEPNGSSRFPKVSEDAPLSETFGFCGDGLPIAVVDASGRLCGKVSPGDIIAALSGRPPSETNRSQQDQDGLFRSAAAK